MVYNRPEVKVKDLNGSFDLGGGGGKTNTILLNGLTKGTDVNDRIAQKVHFVSVLGRFNVTNSNDSQHFCTMGFIRWKRTNGNILSLSSVFKAVDRGNSVRDLENNYDYKILWQRKFLLSNDHDVKMYNPNKKLRVTTTYNSNNNGNQTDIEFNSLWFFIMTNNDAIDEEFSTDYQIRLRFVDA